ncbi:hypothetical protein [Formosa sp. S-31]|uniref:hypothetical protein n=1 Tax=Formosa sp. S-31 TaxID=2790949 RepID=UPI003EB739C4
MKTKSVFILTMLIGIVIAGCSKKPEQKTLEEVKETELISKQFPEAQKEVKAVLDSLFASIQNRNIEELLS